MTISLYLNKDYDKSSLDVSDLINKIHKLNSEISVEYKSKEVILDEIREREPDLVEILERTNPLPDTIILSNI
jgi:cell division protein FtsX